MSGKTDKAKGRAETAAGELLDDEELKRKGRVDKMKGHAKEGVDKAADKVESAIGR